LMLLCWASSFTCYSIIFFEIVICGTCGTGII
jgi:hypothetical protein